MPISLHGANIDAEKFLTMQTGRYPTTPTLVIILNESGIAEPHILHMS